ncbi:hypothetical protein B7Z00_01705 [Candidatus Saccharibacteria bacterium 32-50-10]|nr:MAG: hypothetical protein B7Z00_01705 [Candidatus Saccharibacteria bacterium 32-50-10]
MTKRSEQIEAFYDNLRTVGAMGGDPDSLRDLGYAIDGDDFEEHVDAGNEVLAVTRRIKCELGSKAIVCADCFRDITPGTGCSHIRMGKRGKVYTVATY